MKQGYEDVFSELQSDYISLCLEYAENKAEDVFAFHSTKSVNVGEIYVMPKYRGSSLSKDLLQFVIEHEKQKDARYL